MAFSRVSFTQNINKCSLHVDINYLMEERVLMDVRKREPDSRIFNFKGIIRNNYNIE